MTKNENIELDLDNQEFNYASEFVKHTDKLVYLTGKAGTGKTTFLKSLKSNTTKNTVILAPTGGAAINAGGQTIHSFFHLPFGPFIPNDKRLRTSKELGDLDETTIYSTFKYRDDKKKIIEELELLIIDEISMVRCDTLDIIDKVLKVFRKKPFLPFGGVQVILIGDTFQLPPVRKFDEWQILGRHYVSPFFFSSKIYAESEPIYIELKKIYRQKEQEFIDLLNKIRVNQINEIELNDLNKKYNPTFSSNGIDNHIILTTSNNQVNQTNSTKLDEIKSEAKIFEGEVTGVFPKDKNGSYVLPTEQNLHLKIGAQIMILKNDSAEIKRYFNGKIGKISSLQESKIIVEFTDESKVQIEKSTWNNIQYIWNKEKRRIEETTIGTFTQYPVRLAWAITVHKSQGLTFERVYADLGSAFEDGQIYVALSRCTSFSGLVLKTLIPRNKITTNDKVLEFAKTETPSTLIVQELNSGKADYYYRRVREDYKSSNFNDAYNNFIKALKFRNDIETDVFKKFFIITSNKLASYKYKFDETFRKYNSSNNLSKLLQEEVADLEKSNEEQQAKIVGQNKSLKLLINTNTSIEQQLKEQIDLKSTLSLQVKDLETKFQVLQTNLLSTEEKIRKKDSLNKLQEETIITLRREEELHIKNIKELKSEIDGFKNEIKRLKNLKWYQKLFGQK